MWNKDLVLNKNITEKEIEEIFWWEEEIVKYTAKKVLPIVKKIPILKQWIAVLWVMKDWSLMKRKIVQYEQKINQLSDELEKLNQQEKLNYNFINTEEFINNTLYLTEWIERTYEEDQIDNLRRAYINLLKEENAEINLKSKYMEISSKITPFHISILEEIVKIFDDLYWKEDKITARWKWVTIQWASRELLKKTKLNISDISYLIRDLEKYNLITTENWNWDQYKWILKPEELIVNDNLWITKEEIIQEIQTQWFLDNDFKITQKFTNLSKENKLEDFSIDEKFKDIKIELYNLLFQRNINYLMLNESKVDEYIDKTLISKPTWFWIKFLDVVTKEPIQNNNDTNG